MSSQAPRVTVTQPTPQTESAQLNMLESSGAGQGQEEDDSLFKRSVHVVSDLFSPFSSTALASLPRNPVGFRARSTRLDRIPDSGAQGDVPNYQSVEAAGSGQGRVRVRVPKKIATPIKVETKVWLANERTWVSYLNMGVLLSTLSLALFNASNDAISLIFAYIYAAISVAVMVYGYVVYQRRITRIRKRDPGHFDQIVGPVLICAALFFAVLSNFIVRGTFLSMLLTITVLTVAAWSSVLLFCLVREWHH